MKDLSVKEKKRKNKKHNVKKKRAKKKNEKKREKERKKKISERSINDNDIYIYIIERQKIDPLYHIRQIIFPIRDYNESAKKKNRNYGDTTYDNYLLYVHIIVYFP